MVTLQKIFLSFFAVLLICISSLSVYGETLENVFYGFNKNADRAIEILLKREASNESLSYLRADLFQDRNRALMLQRKINDKYLIQKDELKLIDDLITESSTEGTPIALKRQKLVSILEQTTYELANTKLALKRAERLIKEIDELKKVRFNERFFSFLPLSHSYERMAGLHFPILISAEIFFCSSLDKLLAEIKESKPTILRKTPSFSSETCASLERVPPRNSHRLELKLT